MPLSRNTFTTNRGGGGERGGGVGNSGLGLYRHSDRPNKVFLSYKRSIGQYMFYIMSRVDEL